MKTIVLTVDTDDDNTCAKALEIMSRVALGLILDGIEFRIHGYDFEDEGEQEWQTLLKQFMLHKKF